MPTFKTVNPATEETLAKYSYFSDQQTDQKLKETYDAWQQWRVVSYIVRAEKLRSLAQILTAQKSKLATLITTEMGKPLMQSEAEIEKCAWVCDYYAEHAAGFLADEPIATDGTESYVRYEPLGPVLAIMPWNFPFWQVFRFAAPGLMAGNAALLKHSSDTTGCALKIEELFLQAGFPDHLFTTLLVDKSQIEQIIASKYVAAVTLTGSTSAGQSVAALAGKYLKKTVLELGGSDPYLILDDADLDAAAEACVAGRLLNPGQSCIAAKRFIVTQQNAEPFTAKVKAVLACKKIGDPFDAETDLGPMARADLRTELHEQVEKSIKLGARCEVGGEIPNRKGFYYPATLLTGVKKGMPAYEEELFGPVASIIVVSDEKEAIRVANDTVYGLGSAVFSRDLERARFVASQIQAGSCFVNTFVKSDPRLPFGGIGESGYGRELSLHGIREFTNAKTIYFK